MVTNNEIRKDFGRVMHLLKRNCASKDETQDKKMEGYTLKQGLIIGYIDLQTKKGNDVFQKDIESEFSIRRSTASCILQLMEKNKLIERQVVESDARMKKLVLTDLAKDRLEGIYRNTEEFANVAFDGVTDEEKEVLKVIFQKVIANLERRNGRN